VEFARVTAKKQRTPETVEIVDLTHDGRGVAKSDGKTVFVDGALPGETVSMLRMRRRRKLDEARTEAIIKASPDRVEPACDHFGVCGACSLQHMSGEAQLKAKNGVLRENLRRIGQVEAEAEFEPVAGPMWGYRRRARLGARLVEGKGKVVVGFREKFKSYITDTRECPVLAGSAGELIVPLSRLLTPLTIARRVPQVEICVADNRTALIVRVLDEPTEDDLAALRSFQDEHDVDIYLQTGGLDSVAPLNSDAERLCYRLDSFGLTFRFLPTDFIQINAELNASMVGRTIDLLDVQAGNEVLDLFCGIGNFSLPLARAGAQVTAVEGDQSLVDRARENATLNGLGNVNFHCADLFEDCTGVAWLGQKFDSVLLDPPRAGAEKILPVIAAGGPRKIVYVSCHAATLARDANVLVNEFGYALRGAGVMDMFPHTTHVESIALFERDAS
jgi:23S rRNA (uracil1939-C5)-methyltransferase